MMTFVDLKTLYIVYVVLSVLGVIVMTSLWLQNRKRSPGIALWLVDYVLQLVALLLVTLRGIAPDLISIVLANALIIVGTVVLYLGLERYVGKKSSQLHNCIMAVLFTCAHAYFTYIYPSIELRNVNISLSLFYISAQGAFLMLRRVPSDLRPATRSTGIVLTVFCLVSAVHITGNLMKSQINHLIISGIINALVILAYQTLFIALTFTLFLLVSRRLLMELENKLIEGKQNEEKIKHLANHDVLTDLPSMRLARDRLSVALSTARRHKNMAAVMFIDLDGFKAVNDTLGHDAGDYVLKHVALRLLSCVRETDTVARVGGDEFLIIATELRAPDDAARIAEKAIHLVSRPIIFNGQQRSVTMSIGIALYSGQDEDMDQLIKQADEAMYRVKNSGKNGFTFAGDAIK